MIENVSALITSVSVYKLAETSAIPVRTLYRWAADNKIPGREHVQAAHRQRIERAVRKLKRKKERA